MQFRLLLPIACAVLAAACSIPQRAGPSAGQLDEQAAIAYCKQLHDDPPLEPLRSKASFDGNPTFEMLADRTKVTEAEKPLVAKWSNATIACQERLQRSARQYAHPLIAANLGASQATAIALRAPLYNGEWTWGEFNQARQKLAAENRLRLAQITDALRRQDQQAAAVAQQQASAAYANFLQAQRNALIEQGNMMQSQPRPMSCTTTRYGSTARTDCN